MGLSLDKGRHMGVGNVAGGPLIRRKSHMRLFWWDFRGISGRIRVNCLVSRLVAGLAGAGGAATGGRTRSGSRRRPARRGAGVGTGTIGTGVGA